MTLYLLYTRERHGGQAISVHATEEDREAALQTFAEQASNYTAEEHPDVSEEDRAELVRDYLDSASADYYFDHTEAPNAETEA